MTSSTTAFADGGEITKLLQPPKSDGEDTIKDMVMSAGIEVMAVDWVFQHITGKSLTEEVIMPITGDFTKMQADAEAWRTVAEAMKEFSKTMVSNAKVVHQDWTGIAATAHEVYINVGWRAGLIAEAGIANTIAKGFDAVANGSKKLCEKALDLLKTLVDKLIEIGIKACIPIAGWAAEATTIIDALQLFDKIMKIIMEIKEIVETAGKLWNSLKDIGSQLAKIKDVKSIGDLGSIVSGIHGDVKDIEKDKKDIKKTAREIGEDVDDIHEASKDTPPEGAGSSSSSRAAAAPAQQPPPRQQSSYQPPPQPYRQPPPQQQPYQQPTGNPPYPGSQWPYGPPSRQN